MVSIYRDCYLPFITCVFFVYWFTLLASAMFCVSCGLNFLFIYFFVTCSLVPSFELYFLSVDCLDCVHLCLGLHSCIHFPWLALGVSLWEYTALALFCLCHCICVPSLCSSLVSSLLIPGGFSFAVRFLLDLKKIPSTSTHNLIKG